MKKLCIISALFIFLISCSSSTNNDADKDNKNNTADSSGLTNPSAIDTVKHPTGMDNSSVISTDTAAMNVQNTIKKADSIAKQKNK